jgi:DNA helicase-2/ATP-dependent DNA helicase PcrA
MSRNGQWQLKRLMDVLKTNNMSIWQIPRVDLEYSCPDLVPFIDSIKNIIMPNGVKRDKTQEIEALRAIYNIMIIDTFAGDSAYCESARAYIETLLYLIETNDFKTIFEFLEEVEFLNDKLNGRIKKTKAPIQIATVHEFKGKERDSIYVWNDSDGTFPSAKCDIDNQEQLEEERRVHYIACTRAKKREHIYTLNGKVGMFVKEMSLELKTIAPSTSLKNK